MATRHDNVYWSVGQVSSFMGVSPYVVRLYCEEGQLVSYRTLHGVGHRRIERHSVYRAMGLDSGDGDAGEGKVAYYARVSSAGQKNSLMEQIRLLKEEVSKREGIREDEIAGYSEVCSAFHDRPVLNKLLADIEQGNIKRVFATFRDRISRVPAVFHLCTSIMERHGVELAFLFQDEQDPDSLEDNMQELLSYTNSLSCSISARKNAKLSRKALSKDAIRRGTELFRAKYPVSTITEILNKEGYTATNARGEVTKVSRHVVEETIIKNLATNEQLTEPRTLTNSFEKFHDTMIQEAHPDTRLRKKVLYQQYLQWLSRHGNGAPPVSARAAGVFLSQRYERRYTRNGCIAYCGIAIKQHG